MLIDELHKTNLTQEERTALETLYKAFNEQNPICIPFRAPFGDVVMVKSLANLPSKSAIC